VAVNVWKVLLVGSFQMVNADQLQGHDQQAEFGSVSRRLFVEAKTVEQDRERLVLEHHTVSHDRGKQSAFDQASSSPYSRDVYKSV